MDSNPWTLSDCAPCPDPEPASEAEKAESSSSQGEKDAESSSSSVWFSASVVCGSDGRSYPSQCHLKRAACKEKKDIVMVRSGRCGEEADMEENATVQE